jgi:hypothetical protein
MTLTVRRLLIGLLFFALGIFYSQLGLLISHAQENPPAVVTPAAQSQTIQQDSSSGRQPLTRTQFCNENTGLDIPWTECVALQKLYQLNGTNWNYPPFAPTSPLTGRSWNFDVDFYDNRQLCNWYGIDCTAPVGRVRRITEITLFGTKLGGGTLPVELGELDELQSLTLNNKPDAAISLQGGLPPQIASLPDLIHLNFGNHPELNLDFSTLYEIVCLERLILSKVRLGEPSLDARLGNLRRLHTLELRNLNLVGGLPQVLTLPQQPCNRAERVTSTQDCQFISDSVMNLCVLKLSGNNLTGQIPSWIFELPHLTNLDLSSNQLSGQIPENIGASRSLTDLLLKDNMLSGNIPDSIIFLQNLNQSNSTLDFNNLFETTPAVNTFLSNRFSRGDGSRTIPHPWTNYQNSPVVDFRVVQLDDQHDKVVLAFRPIDYDLNLDNDAFNQPDNIAGYYYIEVGSSWDHFYPMTGCSRKRDGVDIPIPWSYFSRGVNEAPMMEVTCSIPNFDARNAYFFRIRTTTDPHTSGQGNILQSDWVWAVTLLEPVGSIQSDRPTFRWTDIEGEVFYTLRVWDSQGREIFNTILSDDQHCDNASHICAFTPTDVNPAYVAPNGTYTWSVIPWREYFGANAPIGVAGCQGQQGTQPTSVTNCSGTFTISAAPPGLVEGLVVGATDTPYPIIQWTISEAAALATHFRVIVGRLDAEQRQVVYGADGRLFARSEVCGATMTCRLQLNVGLPSGVVYYAFVQSVGQGGTSSGGFENTGYAGPTAFTLNHGIRPPALPQQFEVSTTERNGLVTLRWETNEAATHFNVTIYQDEGGHLRWVRNEVLHRDAICQGNRCLAQPNWLLGNGRYTFYLQAANAVWTSSGGHYDNGYISARVNINYQIPTAVSGGFYPAQNEEISSEGATFRWNATPNIVGYDLWVGIPARLGWQQLFRATLLAEDVCSSQTGTCTFTPGEYQINGTTSYALPTGLLYWNVRAGNPGGWGPWVHENPQNPTILLFYVSDFRTRSDSAPVLLSPANGEIIYQTNVPTVRWRFPLAGGIPDSYVIEVINSIGYSIPYSLDADDVCQTVNNEHVCSATSPTPVPHGVFRWTVQPRWGNAGGIRSESWRFTMLSYRNQPFTVEGTEPDITRSVGWMPVPHAPASHEQYLLSSGGEETLSLRFEGTGVDVVYLGAVGGGTFSIEIDGMIEQMVNTSTPELRYGQMASIHNLPPGQHTLRIIVHAGGQIGLDAILVDGVVLPVPLPPITPPTVEAPPVIVPTPEATPIVPTSEPPAPIPTPAEATPEATPGQ